VDGPTREIFVVDDDRAVRDALAGLLTASDFSSAC
jgi:FixJ family two-component response regulator